MIAPKSPIPLIGWDSWMTKMSEYAAWYSGEPYRLNNFYANKTKTTGVKFWSLQSNTDPRVAVHLPIANDIAFVSSNLLFSEYPDYDTKDEAFLELIDGVKLNLRLREASDMCAAYGGIFLKIDYNKDLSEFPILSCVDPSRVFPTFLSGFLTGYLAYRIVYEKSDTEIYRLFEERRILNGKLVIELALFKGGTDNVGEKVSASEIAEIELITTGQQIIDTTKLGIVYVPNILPNKMAPGLSMGASDFSGGVISLMDSADEVYTSLIRDFRLGAAHLFISNDLTPDREFDPYQELYEKFDFGSLSMMNQNTKPIEEIQFDIREIAHLSSIEAIVKDIISRAGYSPQTFGYDLKIYSESGSALRIKERKSLLTRKAKQTYWLYGLKDLVEQLQIFNNILANKSNEIVKPRITLKDSIVPDESVTAVTLRDMNQAVAISTYQKVKIFNPTWSDSMITEEVSRIFADMKKVAAMKLKPIQDQTPQDGFPNPGSNNVQTNKPSGGIPPKGNPNVR